jgi:hypothetical protein
MDDRLWEYQERQLLLGMFPTSASGRVSEQVGELPSALVDVADCIDGLARALHRFSVLLRQVEP